jgi:hypothetical protein
VRSSQHGYGGPFCGGLPILSVGGAVLAPRVGLLVSVGPKRYPGTGGARR